MAVESTAIVVESETATATCINSPCGAFPFGGLVPISS